MRVIEIIIALAVGAGIAYFVQNNVTCKTMPYFGTACLAKTS
jgi:hypothetical protein